MSLNNDMNKTCGLRYLFLPTKHFNVIYFHKAFYNCKSYRGKKTCHQLSSHNRDLMGL